MDALEIGFVTRGDNQLGMGHVARSLSLAKEIGLRHRDARITFEIGPGKEGIDLVHKECTGTVVTRADACAPSQTYDLLFVDQLSTQPPEMQRLRRHATHLVAFDDTGPGGWLADILVNALYASRAPRPPGSTTVVLDGLKALPLDPAFANVEYRYAGEVQAILVTQGGSDTYGVVPRLVEIMADWLEVRPRITLHVQTGPAFRHEAELEQALRRVRRKVRHRWIPDIAGLFADMDLAVSGGGITACELAAVGVPSILITAEERELETAGLLADAGAAHFAGRWSEDQAGPLLDRISQLVDDAAARRRLSIQARQAVDGRGLNRVLDLIDSRIAAHK